RFAREQQKKATQQQEVDSTLRRAQEILKAQGDDRAIELLQSITARVAGDGMRGGLGEAKRPRDDLHRQNQGAIAKGQQFLAEGAPLKAVEFLQAQPAAYKKSGKFRELLQAAINMPQPRTPEPPPVAPLSEMDAPPPASTMMWDRSSSPLPPV